MEMGGTEAGTFLSVCLVVLVVELRSDPAGIFPHSFRETEKNLAVVIADTVKIILISIHGPGLRL